MQRRLNPYAVRTGEFTGNCAIAAMLAHKQGLDLGKETVQKKDIEAVREQLALPIGNLDEKSMVAVAENLGTRYCGDSFLIDFFCQVSDSSWCHLHHV